LGWCLEAEGLSRSAVELSGVAGAGIVAATPGGLFELTFAIWLIARGFASPRPTF
jgi:hypothetical protein